MPRKLEYKSKDFKASVPYLVKGREGWRWIADCAEKVGGRWEGFVTYKSKPYKTKAEALKHKPRQRRRW